MTRVATLSVFLALTGLACRPQPWRQNSIIGEDMMPLDGAMHLRDMGHEGAYSASVDAKASAADRHGRSAGNDRFGPLASALEDRWVHRTIHAQEGVDVQSVMSLLREESTDARGGREVRDAVRRATCRLGDGNLEVVEPSGGLYSDTGVQVRAENTVFMIEGTDGRYEDVGPGDLLLAVDDVPVAQWRDTTCIAPGSSQGQREARLAASLERARAEREDGPGRAKTITVRRAKSGKTRTVALKWQPEDDPTCVEGTAITGEVGMVTVRRFDCTAELFESQLTTALAEAGSNHVLLDLRRVLENDWGNAATLTRHFVSVGSAWLARREGSSGAFEAVPLEGGETPLIEASGIWVLTSPRCAGACEAAVAAIVTHADVTTAGRATAGSVADATPVEVGKAVSVQVPTVQYALPGTSTPLEGKGVSPELIVTATIDVLARGHDPEVVAVARRIRGE